MFGSKINKLNVNLYTLMIITPLPIINKFIKKLLGWTKRVGDLKRLDFSGLAQHQGISPPLIIHSGAAPVCKYRFGMHTLLT